MRADKVKSLWDRLRSSALAEKLHSPHAPLYIALIVALVAIGVYMMSNLHSCTSTSSSISGTGSLWRTSSAGTDQDLGDILSQIDGAGQTDVLITYDKSGALVGVVVVSEGARDKDVTVKLMRAVQTATGATIDQIEIFEKSK
jgi:hypothetical protein